MHYQILIYSLSSTLLLAVVAIGFNLIFNATRVFHLAHGAMYVTTVVAFAQFHKLFIQSLGAILAVVLAICLSLLLVATLILVIEYQVYRPLFKKKAHPAISLISSLAVYMLLVNLLVFFFGNESITLNHTYRVVYAGQHFRITEALLLQSVVCLAVLIAVFFFAKSAAYTHIRAITDDYTIAAKFGVPVQRSRIIALVAGTILAGIAGIVKGYETAIEPNAGLTVVLAASVAVIAGGVRSIKGTLLACLVIALIENYSVTLLSAQWKDLLIYTMLIIVLIFYKDGFMHVKQRIETK
jgi:branched-chain amino acid transport system permease protein